ncbi:uncharacterized protein LOC111550031 [Piliocolobus tephrosceles]|uniref:uncharacterized protein LOC111550031 n=1 Tax=Piliocolobus tephrosceles TaxID=591936 RepID=UPI000C2A2634|nr:uncharacterized protein LOC111550031 [Piliocolobus tephrosceles]
MLGELGPRHCLISSRKTAGNLRSTTLTATEGVRADSTGPLPPTPGLKSQRRRSGHKSRLLLSFAKAEKSPRGPWRASREKRAVTIPTGRPPRSLSADKAASKALRGPRVTTFRSAEESESGCSLTGSQTIAAGRPLHASTFVSLAPGN